MRYGVIEQALGSRAWRRAWRENRFRLQRLEHAAGSLIRRSHRIREREPSYQSTSRHPERWTEGDSNIVNTALALLASAMPSRLDAIGRIECGGGNILAGTNCGFGNISETLLIRFFARPVTRGLIRLFRGRVPVPPSAPARWPGPLRFILWRS